VDPHTGITIGLAGIAATVTLGYALLCWVWPFTTCRRCAGTGTRRSAIVRRVRGCRRCHGTGTRLRTGRALFNTFAHIRRDAR
jgi:hypothetical protein